MVQESAGIHTLVWLPVCRHICPDREGSSCVVGSGMAMNPTAECRMFGFDSVVLDPKP